MIVRVNHSQRKESSDFPQKFEQLLLELSFDDVALVFVPCLNWMETPTDANGISIRVFFFTFC